MAKKTTTPSMTQVSQDLRCSNSVIIQGISHT